MRDDLGRNSELQRKSFLKNRGEAMGFADRSHMPKQEVHLNDLPIAGGPEAHAVIADC